eukprot:TRINITY_DN2805_c0_g1_i1.p1 TRINITY_DN2805_c0_g1~~TRINITY_DN2805_c0_g1_i1.p1  ORF type:complete len:1307 (-),score=362.35 TRINITY_DN2805_c0_g1_i1:632-4552(-)
MGQYTSSELKQKIEQELECFYYYPCFHRQDLNGSIACCVIPQSTLDKYESLAKENGIVIQVPCTGDERIADGTKIYVQYVPKEIDTKFWPLLSRSSFKINTINSIFLNQLPPHLESSKLSIKLYLEELDFLKSRVYLHPNLTYQSLSLRDTKYTPISLKFEDDKCNLTKDNLDRIYQFLGIRLQDVFASEGLSGILFRSLKEKYNPTIDAQSTPCLHPNILPLHAIVEKESGFYVLYQYNEKHQQLEDVLKFTDELQQNNKKSFVAFQLLSLLSFCHSRNIGHGHLSPSNIFVDQNMWIQLSEYQINVGYHIKGNSSELSSGISSPRYSSSLITNDSSPDLVKLKQDPLYTKIANMAAIGQTSLDIVATASFAPRPDIGNFATINEDLQTSVDKWVVGKITNFEYLMDLNRFAGRQIGNPNYHPVFPWVIDFTGTTKENWRWRDLTKTKYRLTKGDEQLDFQYNSSIGSSPHHITEPLSELTYFNYFARRTPVSLLKKFVRSKYQPNEYPQSMERLYSWTPDEAIPEFYSDPEIFMSIHSDMTDLRVPSWSTDSYDFINQHREALESDRVSAYLHHWIDLTFGYKLVGEAAIDAKNVALMDRTMKRKHGFVQLFTLPHPKKNITNSSARPKQRHLFNNSVPNNNINYNSNNYNNNNSSSQSTATGNPPVNNPNTNTVAPNTNINPNDMVTPKPKKKTDNAPASSVSTNTKDNTFSKLLKRTAQKVSMDLFSDSTSDGKEHPQPQPTPSSTTTSDTATGPLPPTPIPKNNSNLMNLEIFDEYNPAQGGSSQPPSNEPNTTTSTSTTSNLSSSGSSSSSSAPLPVPPPLPPPLPEFFLPGTPASFEPTSPSPMNQIITTQDTTTTSSSSSHDSNVHDPTSTQKMDLKSANKNKITSSNSSSKTLSSTIDVSFIGHLLKCEEAYKFSSDFEKLSPLYSPMLASSLLDVRSLLPDVDEDTKDVVENHPEDLTSSVTTDISSPTSVKLSQKPSVSTTTNFLIPEMIGDALKDVKNTENNSKYESDDIIQLLFAVDYISAACVIYELFFGPSQPLFTQSTIKLYKEGKYIPRSDKLPSSLLKCLLQLVDSALCIFEKFEEKYSNIKLKTEEEDSDNYNNNNNNNNSNDTFLEVEDEQTKLDDVNNVDYRDTKHLLDTDNQHHHHDEQMSDTNVSDTAPNTLEKLQKQNPTSRSYSRQTSTEEIKSINTSSLSTSGRQPTISEHPLDRSTKNNNHQSITNNQRPPMKKMTSKVGIGIPTTTKRKSKSKTKTVFTFSDAVKSSAFPTHFNNVYNFLQIYQHLFIIHIWKTTNNL